MTIEPSTAAPEQGETTLLHTRTTAPRPNVRTLARPDLLSLLDDGTTHPVTLVCGGPGSGKTQLVTAWVDSVRGRPVRVAWVALGPDCNDPQRLWSLVTTALSRAEGPPADLRPPADAEADYVARLLSTLEQGGAPVVLVLEDLHEVQDPGSLRSIDLLIRMLPEAVRVVLLSRSDPALSLHRLRVSGGLTEIRQADLAFDRAEAVDLLAQHHVVLDDAEVDLLLDRTEGWPVGLRLAALSLEGRDGEQRAAAVAAFAGDNRAVADYLVAEVLDRVPAELRRFLLLTSVVERVDGPLAEHLTGTTGGAAALERLERDGVPLVPLDEHQRWYRYHRLVQDVCRHRLSVEDPELVPRLHVAAAEWLADTGEHEEALRHALAARDWTLVGRLAVTHAGPIVFGHAGRSLRALLSSVPDDVATGDPWVATARALALHDEGRQTRLAEQLELADNLSGDLEGSDAMLVGLVLALVRASAARAQYDVDVAAQQSRRAGELAALLSVQVDPARAVPALPAYATHADTLLGKSLVWQGDFVAAEQHLRRAVAASPATRPDPVDSGILARAYLSLVLAMGGRIREAGELAEEALGLGRAAGWSDDVQSTSAWLTLVLVRLQRSEREACSAALDEAARMLERRPDALLDACRWLATARFLAEDGRDARARDILVDVRRLQADLPPNGFLTAWYQLIAAEVELAAGRPAEALRLLEVDPSVLTAPGARVVRGQALVDEGRPDQALAEVEPLVDYLEGGLRSVQALVICAQANDEARRDAKALQCLIDALAQAVPEDHLRPFYRNRVRLLPLLRRYRLSGAPHLDVVNAMLDLDDAYGHRPIESLTDRELAVLQLLPSMMSNEEIASELFVSVNTVKVHLKSLYRKLGVGSRREAVMAGAGLIER